MYFSISLMASLYNCHEQRLQSHVVNISQLYHAGLNERRTKQLQAGLEGQLHH